MDTFSFLAFVSNIETTKQGITETKGSRSSSTCSISAAREVEGARGGVLGQGFCVLRGSFARCFAEVAALFALRPAFIRTPASDVF